MINVPNWVPLHPDDLSEVDRIADLIHPGLPERPEVFAEKRSLFPRGCFKYVSGNKIYGYGISHPWRLHSIPKLDDFLISIPTDANCLYIHDVAVLTEGRGHRAAERYVELMRAEAKALSLSNLTCVSVYGTNVLWGRFGFEVTRSDEIDLKLEGYGPTAKYMIAPTDLDGQ